MKRWLLLLLILTSIGVSAQTKKKYQLVKSYLTDLNNDGKIDTITLSSSTKDKDAFDRVSISIAGFKKHTFNAKYGWALVDEAFLKHNKNQLTSKYLYLKKTDLQTVILLFGTLDGAGYREEFSIINIENNNVKMVFGKADQGAAVESPISLGTLKHSERLNFVSRNIGEFGSYVKEKNADVGNYIPYFVYTISDHCKLNKPLMKQYNQEHYVFAGYEFSDKIQILNPRNSGKPSIYKK